jgi:hypothetical protein
MTKLNGFRAEPTGSNWKARLPLDRLNPDSLEESRPRLLAQEPAPRNLRLQGNQAETKKSKSLTVFWLHMEPRRRAHPRHLATCPSKEKTTSTETQPNQWEQLEAGLPLTWIERSPLKKSRPRLFAKSPAQSKAKPTEIEPPSPLSWLFFWLHSPGAAFIDIVLLWMAIAATTVVFWRRSTLAGTLFVPYLMWVSFAAALNFAIWRLNG